MRIKVGRARSLLPGVLLCLAVAWAGVLVERLEEEIAERPWLEALVLAILLGMAIRVAWSPSDRWRAGIAFSAKTLLEIAVVLLGASLSLEAIREAGTLLLVGIVAVVILAIGTSYAIGRALTLPHRLAVLVACGNSICGNSAIVAVAPVIGASGDEVASSIAFTAVLGVAVVLGLPLLIPLLGLNVPQFGVLCGLTVYAVPQVLAATSPAGPVAVQIGTLVKLVRVLMLGPVVFLLALMAGRSKSETPGQMKAGSSTFRRRAAGISEFVPWFIVGFMLMIALRSARLIPSFLLPYISFVASGLTVTSMAALGLGVDLRIVSRAGPRIVLAATLSLIALGCVSYALIRGLTASAALS